MTCGTELGNGVFCDEVTLCERCRLKAELADCREALACILDGYEHGRADEWVGKIAKQALAETEVGHMTQEEGRA